MSDPFYDLDNFVPERSVGYLLRRAGKMMTSQAEAEFADRDLSLSHWVALTMVGHGLADNCAKVAKLLDHNSGATTRLVDQLEERGLIGRDRAGCDRRIVNLALTPEGERELATQTSRMVEFWNTLLADFRHDEVETLLDLLSRLTGALEAREASTVTARP